MDIIFTCRKMNDHIKYWCFFSVLRMPQITASSYMINSLDQVWLNGFTLVSQNKDVLSGLEKVKGT